MTNTEELLMQHERAREFAQQEARQIADAITLAMAEVGNPRAFVLLDFAGLVSKVARLAELQNEIIEKNRAIRGLADKAIAEAGR